MRFLLIALLIGSAAAAEKVTPEQSEPLIAKKVQLLDVRTPEEWDQGRLVGAKLIDFNAEGFSEKATAELAKDKPILVYCRSGGRSARAAKILEELGFKTVYDLKGGITAWIESGKQVVK